MNEPRGDAYLNLYNPATLGAEQLLREFIDRKGLLERILDIVRQNTPDKPQQHLIVIGPRGMGKTMLLCAIRHRVNRDTALNAEWLPISFHEEQYGIGDLADFWLEAIRHLESALNRPPQVADALLDHPGDDLAERAEARFFELLAESGKRALLLVDNLNDTFAAIHAEEALHQLRALLMEDSRLMLVGTAASYFAEITDISQPFHDFFRTLSLERLNQEELETVLRTLATTNDDSTVPEILEKAPDRVQALRILTGGNPRLAKLGYRILREGLDGDVRRDLERLLDECTPFFKHRIEGLAKEGRRVFDAIARRWNPVTVDDLKKEIRKPSNYISAQIKRLVDEGFVEEASGTEKKKRYQVAERFYNIYYLMRYSREGREKLRWLVVFMKLFYTSQDLRVWAKRLERDLTIGFLAPGAEQEKHAQLHTMMEAADGPRIRRAPFEVIVRQAIAKDDYDLIKQAIPINEDPIEYFGWPYLAAELMWLLDRETRLQLGFRPIPVHWTRQLGQLLRKRELLQKAEDWITGIGGLRHDTAQRADATGYILAWIFGRLEEAENTFRQAIDLDPQYFHAWNHLGIVLFDQDRFTEAENAFRQATHIDPQHNTAWNNLGYLLADRNRFTEAESAYHKSIHLSPNYCTAHANLAVLYLEHLNHPQEGKKTLLRGIELDPDYGYAPYLFRERWRTLFPILATMMIENPEHGQLRQFVLDQLMRLTQSEDSKDVLAALLALDESQQPLFEPLILAMRALQDRTVLYQIAREKRDLVLDVMARISGTTDTPAS